MSLSDLSSFEDEEEEYYNNTFSPYIGPPTLPPSPAPPMPSTSTTSDSKGKAKAVDNSDQNDDAAGATPKPQAETEEEKRLKLKFQKASGIDQYTAHQLVQYDPTPTASLSTSTKLAKALVLLNQAFADSHPELYTPGIPNVFNNNNNPDELADPIDPFPVSTYTALLDLVSSALSDVSTSPAGHSAGAKESRNKSMHGLTAARARLHLEMQGFDMATSAAAATGQSSPTSDVHPNMRFVTNSPLDGEERELNQLMVDNCRLTLLKLKPALLADPPPQPDSPQTAASKAPSNGIAYINRLPAELLTVILRLARKMAEQRPEGESKVDEYGVAKVPARTVRRTANGSRVLEISGSRTAAQRYAHSLAFVCTKWQGPARTVAYSSIHLRRKSQLTKLMDLISTPIGREFTQNVTEINAKLPMPAPDPDMVGMSNLRGRRRTANPYTAAGWAKLDDVGTSSSSAAGGKVEDTPGILFSKLVAYSPALKSLALTIVSYPYSVPFGGRPIGTDYLEENILSTLSNIPSLRTLTIGQSIDFEELEGIIQGLPLLQRLRLDGGFDNFDGRGTVTSAAPHHARLVSLVVGEGSHFGTYSSVTEQQLAWLIEPAVDSLKELALSIMPLGGPGGGFQGMFGGGGGQVANGPSPFASAFFADQLARMGSTLEKLTLRDLQIVATPAPSFQQPPHDGNFDYALTQLTRLVELTIPFHYTGAGLLDALVPSSSTLQNLVFMGTPVNTSAADLAGRIEMDQFSSLRRLLVSGQYVGRGVNGGQGWVGSEVRRLKAVTKEKNITCYLTGGT